MSLEPYRNVGDHTPSFVPMGLISPRWKGKWHKSMEVFASITAPIYRTWFPADNAKDAFAASYPFHSMLLSVFERKAAGALPRFQHTRGIMKAVCALGAPMRIRLGSKGRTRMTLTVMGTAPFDESDASICRIRAIRRRQPRGCCHNGHLRQEGPSRRTVLIKMRLTQ